MRPVTLTFKGINNVIDPFSMGLTLVDNRSHLSGDGLFVQLDNIDVDNNGNAVLRDEIVSVQPVATHSLFSGNGLLMGVQSQQLCVLSGTASSPIYSLMSDAPLSYTLMSNDYIVFSNGVDIGYVYSGIASAMPAVDAVETVLATGTTVFTFKSPLPAGDLVAFFSGSLYSARQNADGMVEMSYTDAYEFSTHEIENYICFPGEPTLLMGTDDTLWVSNGRSLISLNGSDDNDFTETSKAPVGAVKGTAVAYDGDKFGMDGISGRVILVTTTDGVYLLTNGGRAINLSEGTASLPQAVIGSAGIIEKGGYKKYVVSLSSREDGFNHYVPKEVLY